MKGKEEEIEETVSMFEGQVEQFGLLCQVHVKEISGRHSCPDRPDCGRPRISDWRVCILFCNRLYG